jgi:hypothetical protein
MKPMTMDMLETSACQIDDMLASNGRCATNIDDQALHIWKDWTGRLEGVNMRLHILIFFKNILFERNIGYLNHATR